MEVKVLVGTVDVKVVLVLGEVLERSSDTK